MVSLNATRDVRIGSLRDSQNSRRMCIAFDATARRWVILAAAVFITSLLAGCSESPPNQLLTAVAEGKISDVERLLDTGVDVNYRTPTIGDTALGYAASMNRLEIAELLLKRGADPNTATNENYSPLQAAAWHGYVDVARLLITAGANVNAAETRYGFTPLLAAARSGSIETVMLLLDAHADRDARTKDGRTVEQVALQYGHINVVKLLEGKVSSLEGT